MKNNSQSTTHIDLKVGTGGNHVTWSLGQMVFQSNPMDFISWYNPSQAYTGKTCVIPTADRNIIIGHTYYQLLYEQNSNPYKSPM